jgi:hypothetical protein
MKTIDYLTELTDRRNEIRERRSTAQYYYYYAISFRRLHELQTFPKLTWQGIHPIGKKFQKN